MGTAKKIDWAARLARLKKRRDPEGLEESKSVSEAADWEAVMAPLKQLDSWTAGAVRRYAAAALKAQSPGLEEIGSSDINGWIYNFLKYYGFDELMSEVKVHTDGQFENTITVQAKVLVDEVMNKARGTQIRLCNCDDSGKEGNHYWDKDTGKSCPEPKNAGFTKSELCPKHRKSD